MHLLAPLLLSWLIAGPLEVVDPNDNSTDVSILPIAGYGADDGLGAGVIAGIYWHQSGIAPYKFGLASLLYWTDRQVTADALYIDWLQVGGLPLRLITGGFFWATLNDTYCGLGNLVSCNPAVANAAADTLQLPAGTTRQNFINSYYYRRYLNPNAEVKLLWQLQDEGVKKEITLSWRGSGYIPGKFGDLSPYSNNYYAQAFPTGEPGFASVLTLGFMMDDRDQEGSPTSGYWFDTSLRVAAPAWGSTWTYTGANATMRVYVPLSPDHAWVLATRFIADFIFGTPSVVELSEIGCYSLVPGGLQGFGGQDVGRGIRQNRYLGRIRLIDQLELRWMFAGFNLLAQHFDMTVVGFADAAWVGVDYHDFGGDPRKIIVSEGGGLRIIWDKNFIVRFDLATSAAENFGVDAYINVNNVF